MELSLQRAQTMGVSAAHEIKYIAGQVGGGSKGR